MPDIKIIQITATTSQENGNKLYGLSDAGNLYEWMYTAQRGYGWHLQKDEINHAQD